MIMAAPAATPIHNEGLSRVEYVVFRLNNWLIEKFCTWLDGGAEMETHVEANLHAAALIFAGIESARSGKTIDVQDYIRSFDGA